ncbi:MAG: hypothetical protein DI539_08600 [Flavobacterium psychrophilum]|nr:MAG: hypothetical protein DI539_08600 [Flavobacterium psychrophilum]
MQVLLFLFALIIIVFNLIINLSNITRIIKYCLKHNTLNKFWPNYYKACVSGRAIYSTIIASILALILFLLLVPIIIIRGILKKEEIEQMRKSGVYFDYNSSTPERSKIFKTNLPSIGLNDITINSSGNINTDCMKVIDELTRQSKNEYTLVFDPMQEIEVNSEIVTVPLLITVNTSVYPAYFIYTPFQKEQYTNISNTLKKNGIHQTVYFSLQPL